MADNFSEYDISLESPGVKWVAVTPSDDTDLAAVPRGLYIGGYGDVAMVGADGNEETFPNMADGSIYPLRPVRIKATGTTATNIMAVY